jgi:hypothetical protein
LRRRVSDCAGALRGRSSGCYGDRGDVRCGGLDGDGLFWLGSGNWDGDA